MEFCTSLALLCFLAIFFQHDNYNQPKNKNNMYSIQDSLKHCGKNSLNDNYFIILMQINIY